MACQNSGSLYKVNIVTIISNIIIIVVVNVIMKQRASFLDAISLSVSESVVLPLWYYQISEIAIASTELVYIQL